MTAPIALQMRGLQIVDIRHLGARELEPLLIDETVDWDVELDCDFSKFADLVRQFADARRLGGAALLDRGEVAGCGYTALEEHKGLITDAYVRPGWRGESVETALLRTLFDGLIETSGVRRIESQLMLLGEGSAKALQRERLVGLFERIMMKLDGNTPLAPGRRPVAQQFQIEPWLDHHHDEAAAVLALGHVGHIDAQINDQYRSFAGTHRLLGNILQFPGFYRPASFSAFDKLTGAVAGISLSAFMAGEVAQITEICVTPSARGAGLGYELLRRSISKLREAGGKRVTLIVTTENDDAVSLYTRCGFHEMRRFYACVWEKYPARFSGRYGQTAA